jgi:hypothetical protein
MMFKKVHSLNKNASSVATQRDVNKDQRKLEYNYPPIAVAKVRDGRFLQTRQVWVQGLPMDITQIIGLVEILKSEYDLPITDNSREELCSLVAEALVLPTWVKGSKPIDIIGSTTAVGAFVFDLEEASVFTAVPNKKSNPTVLEFVMQATVVVRTPASNKGNKKETTTNENRDMNLTIVAIPWTISVKKESEIRLVLRFHSFGMDAKSEMVHCILQEIAIAHGTEQESIREIQVLPRIIFVDAMPFSVLDVIVPYETEIDPPRTTRAGAHPFL